MVLQRPPPSHIQRRLVEASHVFTPFPGDTVTLQFGPPDATAQTCPTPTAWVTRNESLIGGRETAGPFILRSAPVC